LAHSWKPHSRPPWPATGISLCTRPRPAVIHCAARQQQAVSNGQR
jgi:hypothetical protein